MISTRSVGLLIDTVVCLTLAKWETVSGRFGGYLMFAFWRQLTSKLRYNHASIAKVSLLLTSTTCAVVATRAHTCRTSNSIMSSLSDIFIAPVTSTSFFMVLLLLRYEMLVAYIWTSNTARLYVWS